METKWPDNTQISGEDAITCSLTSEEFTVEDISRVTDLEEDACVCSTHPRMRTAALLSYL